MFSYNRVNYPAKNRLSKYAVLPNEHSQEVQCMSIKVSDSAGVAAFFGIIEELVLANNCEYLSRMHEVCRKHLDELKRSKGDATPCEKFMTVAAELVAGMEGEDQNTTLLKDLYAKKQSIAPYLEMLAASLGPSCLARLSEEFKIRLSLYEVRERQSGHEVVLVEEFNKGQQYDKLLEVRLLSVEQGYYLTYPFSPAQMDSISRMCFKSEKQRVKSIEAEERAKFVDFQKEKRIKELEASLEKCRQQQQQQSVQLRAMERECSNIKEHYDDLNAKFEAEAAESKRLKEDSKRKHSEIERLKEENEELERKLRLKDTAQSRYKPVDIIEELPE